MLDQLIKITNFITNHATLVNHQKKYDLYSIKDKELMYIRDRKYHWLVSGNALVKFTNSGIKDGNAKAFLEAYYENI